ncbi:MAG: DUF2182 domain-containing protein [Chloroflexia bacterium]|nr:DUF2182 domain-containing protein [Chloroflexia bacterium]
MGWTWVVDEWHEPAAMEPVTLTPIPGRIRPRGLWSRRMVAGRGQLTLLGLLAVLTIGAWVLTIHQARTMDMGMGIVARGAVAPAAGSAQTEPVAMDGMVQDNPTTSNVGMVVASGMSSMARDGWSWDGFATFFVVWAVMMAAMMLPAATPVLLLFRTISAKRRERGHALVPTWVFATGYLLIWAAAGGVTWILVQLGSEMAGRLSTTSRGTWAPLALGATLAAAGLYQFTPLKSMCLRQCQSPMGFLMTHWRDGSTGALRMGAVHGGYCLGCCWALFAVLVAVGVMSLAWMLLLTLVVFAEKVLPLGQRAPRVVGTAFLALGVLVAVGATGMPWSA